MQHKPTGKMASPPSVNNENYDPKVDKARKASSNDPGWKYGYWADLQKRDQVTCTLCDTMVCGGIKRLKQRRQVDICLCVAKFPCLYLMQLAVWEKKREFRSSKGISLSIFNMITKYFCYIIILMSHTC